MCFAHGDPLERLSSAQQLAIDLADLLQDLAGSMVVGQQLGGLGVRLLRHVIHLWPQARVAHRKIILGTMAWTVGAFASRLATAFVTLDERATQDGLEWRQLAQKRLAAFAQGGGRLFLHFYRTTYITGLIVFDIGAFFNSFC